MSRIRVVALAAALVAALALAVLWSARDDGAEAVLDASWVRPPGHWNRLPGGPGERPGEDLAQVLSLPYSAGAAPAPDAQGVVHHDPDAAWPGVNLYVSGHGPEAILVDMDGAFLHRWRRSFPELFPDRPPGPETDFLRRAHLLADGSLVMLFQGGGLARVDAESEIQWTAPGAFFNDLAVDGARVLAIGKEARVVPSIRRDEPILEDFLSVHDLATGERTARAPLLPAFERGGFGDVLRPLPAGADIFHTNTVRVLDAAAASLFDRATGGAVKAGDLLLSLREVDVLAVLDGSLDEVLWARRGPWDAQHEPVPTADGLLVFDNRGGADGRSRILLWDVAADRPAWTFEHPTFASPQAGTVAPLPGGHVLVTSSEQGRAFELDAAGRVVWELVSPHRAGAHDELIATLFEVQRLPADTLAWRD